MASAIEKVIEIAANNLFDNASVQTCLSAVTDLSNNLDTRVTAVIDGAPGALDTLNELAAALGDDSNFATTVTNSLATKYQAGNDVSFNDLSANDVSGVNFFTTGGSFVGDLVGTATSSTSATTAITSTSAESLLSTTTTNHVFARRGVDADLSGGVYQAHFGENSAINSDGTIVAFAGDAQGSASFLVKVFKWDGSSWSQLGNTFENANSRSGEYHQNNVSLNSDGTILAFGEQGWENGSVSTGRVRIFKWNGSTWNQIGSDIIGGTISGNVGYKIGSHVKINGDGTIIVLSGYDRTSSTYKGEIYVYTWNGSAWSQRGSTISLTGLHTRFAEVFDINKAGDIIATSDYFGSNPGGGTYHGAIYIYDWNGSAWVQRGSTIYGSSGDQIGKGIALNDSGTIMTYSSSQIKKAWVYQYADSAWSQYGDTIDYQKFGSQSNRMLSLVDIAGDGKKIIFCYSNSSWSRYYLNILTLNGSTWTVSSTATINNGVIKSSFISNDGSAAGVGVEGMVSIHNTEGFGIVYQLVNTTYSDDFNISYNSPAKQIEFKTKDLTETEVTSKMNLDNSGNLTLEGTLTVDTINEKTDASGVTIEQVLLKDNNVTAHTVTAQNYAVGSTNFVSASRQGNFRDLEVKDNNNVQTIQMDGTGGNVRFDGTLRVDTINEKTDASGVTIDGVLLKDGGATFTGDVSGNDASFNVVDIHTLNLTTALSASSVGLGNVDNTTDVGKPVSTAQQTALDLKANLAGPTFTGNVTMSDISANDASFNVVDIHTLNLTTSLTKSDVGLGNVDNTTDVGKPVSTAQQTALDLKANLAGPTFTGKVTMSDVSANDGSFNVVDIAALKVNGVSITQNGSGGTSLNVNSDISINAIDAQDASFNVLRTSATMALGGHIIPTSNAQYDLGNAEYKIRHLFLSDNSLWIGDDHKIDISGGKMKFKKRKNDKVPGAVTTAGGNEAGALSHGGVGSLADMTLQKWHDYAVSLNGALGIQDLFGNDKPDEFDTDRDLLNAVQLPTKSDAGAPATTPTAGTMIFNTNENKLYIYNGSAWRAVDTV